MTGKSAEGFRTILRSSSIIGGAQIIAIVARILRMKVVALLLGPTGVGTIGLYLSLIETAAAMSALGWGTVGTRQVAAAKASGDDAALARSSRTLLWGSLGLALLGALAFWALSGLIARQMLGMDGATSEIAWLAAGVGLTVAAGSQAALLSGLRRIGDIARINVTASVIGTALGIAALWIWGRGGLIAMVLITPLITFLVGRVIVSRLNLPSAQASSGNITREWGAMTALGIPFMASGLVTALGFLTARTMVQNDLGAADLGYFQAAWAISMTYLGFILTAMGTDYFPRVTGVIGDHGAAGKVANEQTEVALLLCGPAIIVAIACAPWIIQALYSAEFGEAAGILRWQLLGDILKVLSWPLGFVVLALGAGRVFIFNQCAGMAAYLAVIHFGMPIFGVKATGMAYLAIYAVTLPVNLLVVRQRIAFRWNKAVILEALALIAAAALVTLIALTAPVIGAALGLIIGAVFGVLAILRISDMAELGGKMAVIARLGRRLKQWIGQRS